MFSIETLHAGHPSARPRVAMFDFDGTISLIREGWHRLLIDMNFRQLRATPKGRRMPEADLVRMIKDFVQLQIGKQTIHQAEALAGAVEKLGGTPPDPEAYNAEYLRRLDLRVQPRLESLRHDGDPRDHVVPGTFEMLEMMRRRGVKLYLVSGTEDGALKEDARCLGVTGYFDGGIFGGLPDPTAFSKAMIVRRILRENPIRGEELIGFGDGHTETVDIRCAGGFTVGVASNETTRQGIDPWKRDQLIDAGADIIIPDFSDVGRIEETLFLGER